MLKFTTIEEAELKVEQDAVAYLNRIREISGQQFQSVAGAMAILEQLRAESYEDLNQIQHEHMIIRAVKWLITNSICPAETIWEWNPRQTGTADEPDLRGLFSGAVILSAEATASPYPKGMVDQRMTSTLRKLAGTPGQKFYFVRSNPMAQRARTKIIKASWPITVCVL